jgi:hypothetical protein
VLGGDDVVGVAVFTGVGAVLTAGVAVGVAIGGVLGYGVSDGYGVVVGLAANCDQVEVSTWKPLLTSVLATVKGIATMMYVAIRRALVSFMFYHFISVYSTILVFYSLSEAK